MTNRLSAAVRARLGRLSARLVGTVTHFDTAEPLVALTFDDGPNPLYTPRLLALLKRFDAQATFFMVGEAARQHAELVCQVAAAGHTVANHSWDHPSFVEIPRAARRQQLESCQRTIAPHGTRLFRPPWGSQNRASRLDALWLRYDVIAWNLDVGDWWDRDPAHMADALTKGVRPGSVILLHDALFHPPSPEENPTPFPERDSMLAALETFFHAVGPSYRFVTIPEMFRLARPVKQLWFHPLASKW